MRNDYKWIDRTIFIRGCHIDVFMEKNPMHIVYDFWPTYEEGEEFSYKIKIMFCPPLKNGGASHFCAMHKGKWHGHRVNYKGEVKLAQV
jgi:hypothetical protein